MQEPPIEKVVPEEDFRRLLIERATPLLETCAARGGSAWTKRRLFDLSLETDEVEALLDDYGARTNRRFSAFTEIVASIRGFALAGMSLRHLVQRLAGYGVLDAMGDRRASAHDDLGMALQFVEAKLSGLMRALLDEGRLINVTELAQGEGQPPEDRTERRFRLPHNIDLDRIEDEEQRIAEVATKFLDTAEALRAVRISRLEDEFERESFMAEHCTEVDARNWEASVHNLQSSYDTYVKDTVLETGDPRLRTLRGHISAALHVLQAVTHLTHFVERHSGGLRSEAAEAVLQSVVPRREVRDVALNRLLIWAWTFMDTGTDLASSLLPSYTNVSQVTLCLREGVHLHARPASLVVAVVQHHGTPVELEVAGNVCNAGSILELMVAIGSNPDAREYLVRGDERPLRDLVALFAADLGESGLDGLPDSLGYLRGR